MTIDFESIIKKNNSKEEDQVFKFTSYLKTFEEKNNESILEFEEPSKKVLNRFEISKEKVNIFSGPTTINLELNKKTANIFVVPGAGEIKMFFYGKKIAKDENGFKLEYDLLDDKENIINSFFISLIINNIN